MDVRLDPHNGTAAQVSAEHLTDSRTGTSYYTALVQVDQNELADLPNVKLYPGMPANVMFPTIERSALNYLVGPLTQSFNRAFRQRAKRSERGDHEDC